jgi:hypothetical protein
MAYTDRSPIIMQGKVLIAERTFNGALLTSPEWIGNCDNFTLSFKQKRESIKDNFTGRGLTIAAPVVETEVEVMFNMLDVGQSNFARASFGTKGAAETAGTGESETYLAKQGSYIQLAYPVVSNVAISGLTVTTDYVVERDGLGGLIRFMDDAPGLTDTDQEVTVTYDYAANNGKVEAFTESQRFYTLWLNGINVAQAGQPHILQVHQIQLDAFKKADFIDKRQMKLESGVEILIDSSIADDGELSQVFWMRKG